MNYSWHMDTLHHNIGQLQNGQLFSRMVGRDWKTTPRPGRPITSFTKANIDLVHEIVRADPHATYDYIEAERGSTINANNYIENSLNPVIQAVNRQRPISGTTNMKILHDNARPHITKTVKDHLNQARITIIRHPPYLPDLAPSDFWLFDQIKNRLDDHIDVQSQKRQITAILQDIPRDEYRKTFEKWLDRMQLCINNNGDYFEHLIK